MTDYFAPEGIALTFNTSAGLTGTAALTGDRSGVMVGWNLATDPKPSNRLAGILDGTSNTIMAGTKSLSSDQYAPRYGWNWDESIAFGGNGGTGRGAFWGSGYWNNQARTIQRDGPNIDRANAWGSPYAGGGLFLFCDGSVRSIRHGADMTTFGYLLTPNGGEVAGDI